MTDTPFFEVSDLVVATGHTVPNFSLDTRLNLFQTGRESSATTTMLTFAGRMKPKAGTITLRSDSGEEYVTPRAIGAHVALAGVSSIDGLDRGVKAKTFVREVAAWSSPWYRNTPHDVTKISEWNRITDLIDLPFDLDSTVGSLSPSRRFIFRVALALLARPEPALLVVDDIDQVRSLSIRNELIVELRDLSEHVPIIVASTNPDTDHQFDRIISQEGATE